jgi:hypothetical protein
MGTLPSLVLAPVFGVGTLAGFARQGGWMFLSQARLADVSPHELRHRFGCRMAAVAPLPCFPRTLLWDAFCIMGCVFYN